MIWILLFGAILVGSAAVGLKRPGVAIGLMMVMFGLEQLLQAIWSMLVWRWLL